MGPCALRPLRAPHVRSPLARPRLAQQRPARRHARGAGQAVVAGVVGRAARLRQEPLDDYAAEGATARPELLAPRDGQLGRDRRRERLPRQEQHREEVGGLRSRAVRPDPDARVRRGAHARPPLAPHAPGDPLRGFPVVVHDGRHRRGGRHGPGVSDEAARRAAVDPRHQGPHVGAGERAHEPQRCVARGLPPLRGVDGSLHRGRRHLGGTPSAGLRLPCRRSHQGCAGAHRAPREARRREGRGRRPDRPAE
mmetsp:Transcript_83151/g.240220  ORF Transcript_83151/g.240220 Transcript_83151/m.240220 type:complete len:252 (-) Transcript_83151:314-1069(-)